jgi:PAS domain S-box-containing protein
MDKKIKLFNAIFENSDLLVAGMDTKGRVVIWNPACEKATGFPKEEVLGKHFEEILLPERTKEDTLRLFEVFKDGIVAGSVIVPLLTKTGEERILSWKTNIITDDEGRPEIGLGLGTDITERLKAEEELVQRSSELESVFQALPDLFFRLRLDGTIIDYRAGQPSELYTLPKEFLGKKVEEVLPPDAAQKIIRAIEEVNKTKSLTLAEYSLPFPEGEQVFEARMMSLYEDQVVAVVRNITARKESEEIIHAQRDLAIKLSGTTDLNEAFRISFEALLEVTGMDCGGIYLADKDSGAIDLVYHEGLSQSFVEAVSHYERGSRNANLIYSGQSIYFEIGKLDIPRDDIHNIEGLKALAAVPLRFRDEIIGCVNIASHHFGEIPEPTRDVIEIMAGQIGEAVSRARLVYALRESEMEKKTILESVSELVNYQDTELRIIWANQAACDSVGMTTEQLLGRHCYEIWGRRDDPCEGCPVVKVLENGQTQESEMTTPDGRIWFIRGYPVKDESGNMVGVVEVTLDITDRKRAEDALRESEERYRTTFETTGTAMFLLDRQGFLIEVNREIEDMIGYTSEEVVGKKRYMDFVVEEDLDMVKKNAVYLLTGEMSGPIQYECRVTHKNGKILHVIVNVNMFPGIDRSVVSIIDISDKKAYERELMDRAEQMRDFLDIAAHELRHPATLMKGYAMTLETRDHETDEVVWHESLQAIEKGADRLVDVVEELLDVSRIERDSFPVLKENVKIEPLVRRAVEEMLARGCDNELSVELEDEVGRAWVDPERFVRLLVILLDNAVKYSPAGSKIEILGGVRKGHLDFLILDHGVGVPEEDEEKIFERFYQVEDVLHHGGPGLGLGLYIGRRIVEGHGGEIWYEPREGEGSILRFTLPVDG